MNILDIATDKLHYKRIRGEPMYRMMLQMNDMRAEQEPSLCQDMPLSTKEARIVNQTEEPWAKRQWNTVNQLRGMVKFLYLKETERRANASKRKPIYNNNLIDIYKGAEDVIENPR